MITVYVITERKFGNMAGRARNGAINGEDGVVEKAFTECTAFFRENVICREFRFWEIFRSIERDLVVRRFSEGLRLQPDPPRSYADDESRDLSIHR